MGRGQESGELVRSWQDRYVWPDGQRPLLTSTDQKGLKTTTVCDALDSV